MVSMLLALTGRDMIWALIAIAFVLLFVIRRKWK
jgi:hypothetical protein